MIIDRITLKNIRSHADTTVHFARGVNLIFGDIGHGKSSLAYALEFAFFGATPKTLHFNTAGHKDMLMTGADNGYVEVEFSIPRGLEAYEKYIVRRGLRRNKKGDVEIWDKETFIIYPDGRKAKKTTTELTEAIKQLGFAEKGGRSRSTEVFSMGIFVRQEMMKVILLERSEERKNTLRRIFDIQDYKTAQKNLEHLVKAYNSQIRRMENEKSRLEELSGDQERRQEEIKESSRELRDIETRVPGLEREREEVIKVIGGMEDLRERISKLSARKKNFEGSVSELKSQIGEMESEVKKLSEELNSEKELVEKEKQYNAAREEMGGIQDRLEALSMAISRFARSEEQLKGVLEEMDRLSIAVKEEDKLRSEMLAVEKELETYGELEKKGRHLAEWSARLKEMKEGIKRKARLIEERKKIAGKFSVGEERLKKLEERKAELEAISASMKTMGDRRARLEEKIHALSGELEGIEKELDNMSDLDGLKECPKCGQPLDSAHIERILEELQGKKKELEGKLEGMKKELEEIEVFISSKEKELESLGNLEKEISRLTGDMGRLHSELERVDKELAELKDVTEETLEAEENRFNEENAAYERARKRREELLSASSRLKEKLRAIGEAKSRIAELSEMADNLRKGMEGREQTEAEYSELKRKLDELKSTISRLEPYHNRFMAVAEKKKRLKELEEKLQERRTRLGLKESSLRTIRAELEKLEAEFSEEELKAARDREKEITSHLARMKERKSILEEKVASAERELEELTRRRGRAENEIKRLELKADMVEWLKKVLKPALEEIETRVFNTRRIELNELFQSYFDTLIPEDSNLSVEISSDPEDGFAPVIYRGESVATTSSLSGGESAAVALAYRLALNQFLGYYYEPLRNQNLLILDEPTDGFSSEQIARFTEIIDGLNLQQLIIITHERENFENIGSRIIEIRKDANGHSIVDVVSE